MTLSLQEISDRLEIQDLVYRYADIIDAQRFDELRTVFTDDAHIDYAETGGAVGSVEEIIAFLKKALAVFPNTQHLNGNMQISLYGDGDGDGDTATGRVMCFNPMELDTGEGRHTFMLGVWYRDHYRRCAGGWRIARRVEEKSWHFNLPDFMQMPQ